MTNEKLLKLATEEPEVTESVTQALRTVINFQRTRGAMLAALRDTSQVGWLEEPK